MSHINLMILENTRLEMKPEMQKKLDFKFEKFQSSFGLYVSRVGFILIHTWNRCNGSYFLKG